MLIAICDDEQFFLDYFEKTIKDYYYYDRGMTCQIIKYLNGHDLMTDIETQKYKIDVAVLDIEMPGYSGIELVKDIRKICPDLPVMFLSSNETCGDVAVEYDLCAYIYKSAGETKLYNAFDFLLEEEKIAKQTYDTKNISVRISDIVYIEMKNQEALFHTESGIYNDRNTLSNLQIDSRFDKFVTLSRSLMVNYRFIADLKDVVYLTTGETLKYSQSKKENILKKCIYLRGQRFR